MTFPQILSVTTTQVPVAATSHPITMPASVAAGDLLLAFIVHGGNTTLTNPAGWSSVYSRQSSSLVRGRCAAIKADGTEGGTTPDWVTGSNQSMRVDVYQISAGTWMGDSVANSVSATDTFGTTANPNPPSHTPSWGALETLWFATFHSVNNVTSTGQPANYTNLVEGNDGGGDLMQAQMRRQLVAASEDPGAYTVTLSTNVAATLAVRGAPGGSATGGKGKGGGGKPPGGNQPPGKLKTFGVGRWPLSGRRLWG